MGTGTKHLLGYLFEALVEEMLVHILEQEKQLNLQVLAQTLCITLAFFLQDAGKAGTKNFCHEASVF